MQCSGSLFSPRLNIYTLSLFLFIPVLIFLLPSQTAADTPKNDPPEWSGEQKAPDQPETNDRNILGHSKTEGVNFCVADVGFGPLRLKSQSPFQSLRMGVTPLAPSTITKGEWEFFLAGSLGNIWANGGDDYMLDYETLNTQVSIAYGITQTFKLELGYEGRRVFGGFLDPVVVAFHDIFGIDQTGRDKVPYGQVNIDIKDADGNTVISEFGEAIVSRGLILTLQQNVTCGTKYFPAFSYALYLRQELEYPNIIDRSNPYDFGISLATSRRFSDFYLYLSGGYIWFGGNQVQEVELKATQLSGMIAGEWRYIPTQSLLLQLLATEGQAVDLGPFSEPSYEVTLGWKWEMKPKMVFELGLIENIITFDNSPDFGIHAGITSRF